jgi:hypothetical protein
MACESIRGQHDCRWKPNYVYQTIEEDEGNRFYNLENLFRDIHALLFYQLGERTTTLPRSSRQLAKFREITAEQ